MKKEDKKEIKKRAANTIKKVLVRSGCVGRVATKAGENIGNSLDKKDARQEKIHEKKYE